MRCLLRTLALMALFFNSWCITCSADNNPPLHAIGALSKNVESGVWSIGGASWDLEVKGVPAEKLNDRLAQPPKARSKVVPNTEHTAIFDSLRTRFRRMGSSGDLQVYGINSPQLLVRLFGHQKGDQHVPVGAHIAYPRGRQGWTVLTATPASVKGSAESEASLLPLPQGFRRVCSRRGHDGSLQCDVISVPYTSSQMTKFWQAQGWRFDQPEWARLAANEWLCYQGDRCIQISSRPSPNAQGTAWVIVTADAIVSQKN